MSLIKKVPFSKLYKLRLEVISELHKLEDKHVKLMKKIKDSKEKLDGLNRVMFPEGVDLGERVRECKREMDELKTFSDLLGDYSFIGDKEREALSNYNSVHLFRIQQFSPDIILGTLGYHDHLSDDTKIILFTIIEEILETTSWNELGFELIYFRSLTYDPSSPLELQLLKLRMYIDKNVSKYLRKYQLSWEVSDFRTYYMKGGGGEHDDVRS